MRPPSCRTVRNPLLLLLAAVLAVATAVDALDSASPKERWLGTASPLIAPRTATQPTFATLVKRVLLPVAGMSKRDLECRKIHKPKYTDKCAFVHDNCEDEEVGFFDYLAFYYCKFGEAGSALKAIPMTIMIGWMTILFATIGIAASDFFCVNLSTISTILGMSQSLAGVTFLAFGNGSPDVFSTFAAMKINSGSLAVGELVGAASFITAVVAGSMAIVRPFTVAKKSFVRDVIFFMISVAFGIYFLYDGRILTWEAVSMVGLYVFYVIFVVGWHWYTKRQKRKKIIEIRTRGHYTDIAEEEELEDEEDASVGVQRGPQLTLNTDFSALERNDLDSNEDGESEEDRQEREEFAELNSNMRLGRPSVARHVTPVTPIRPSLIGALEFRSVMQSLNQDKNLHGRPIYLRSYSEESQNFTLTEPVIPRARHSRHHSTIDGSELAARALGVDRLAPPAVSGRARAVSVNDAPNISNGSDYFTQQTSARSAPRSPSITTLSLSETSDGPPLIELDQGSPLPTASFNHYQLQVPSSQHLAPPPNTGLSPNLTPVGDSDEGSPSGSPLLGSRTSSRENSPPRYLDSPRPISRSSTGINGEIPIINLPPSATNTELSEFMTLPVLHPRLFKYWPYAVLPTPDVFFSTLFPTLYTFNEKNLLGKFLAIISAPSIFLLTITLPIVEVPETTRSRSPSRKPSSGSVLPSPASSAPTESGFDGQPAWMEGDDGPKDWNRWLVATQFITAPVFIVLAVCAGQIPLLFPILYALLGGLTALLLLLFSTRADRPPKYRFLLCFVGFAVSICWISSIANEVVGVLKALGVILGISDAILGLTIFAVGNSLGDLVADITVARLGFPVMALSACFGGPMLNILLGIGISGIYMTVRPAAAEDYYQIEVSSTLMISAVTLLATLVFLLVAVPMNNWRMTRGIGWSLVVIWAVSTVVNVIVEVSGVGKRLE
ncbi:hypothetical protein H072_6844 [Dactylellina haptotyla CBS 200.50]|uniref:Sodium/calcium exchanger membrane region domain-containing protein n=1 Tax=Dactylellina haptotyla (strain CBS 200.50) TaxID=1284197 RepID=S8A8M9_DACHA|nr:hypothetical protein H072_6844 [Dactylellina haptotyla CBS 200.50]